MKTFLILSILILSVYSGNLLRCFEQIGKTIIAAGKFGVAAKGKDKEGAQEAIKNVAGQISPMINECANPICLVEAKKRCEEKTGKECEQWGAMMYPKCAPGFKPFGCCLCVQACPPGFRDDGLFCAKPAPYGRGAGYPWKFGDGFNLDGAMNRCNAKNQQGCEKNGAIIYPKCAEGFHNVGCCVCSPNCPQAGMTDIGVSCAKAGSYGRGFGYPIYYSDCSEEHESDEQPEQSCDQQKLDLNQLKDVISELTEELEQEENDPEGAQKTVLKMNNAFCQFQN